MAATQASHSHHGMGWSVRLAAPWRISCCGGTRVERLPWEAAGHRMTRHFFDLVAALCRRLPISAVAQMAGLSWDTVARIDKESIGMALGGWLLLCTQAASLLREQGPVDLSEVENTVRQMNTMRDAALHFAEQIAGKNDPAAVVRDTIAKVRRDHAPVFSMTVPSIPSAF